MSLWKLVHGVLNSHPAVTRPCPHLSTESPRVSLRGHTAALLEMPLLLLTRYFPLCSLFRIYSRSKKSSRLHFEFRHLSAEQVPWTPETDWHLFLVPNKMLQKEINEGEDVARTDGESETAPFKRVSKF